MYFNRKNAEQKNWRMIKKGKHFLFGCSLVFAIGAALVAPSVKADTVEANPEAGSTTEGINPVVAEEDVTYAAPAVEVAPSTLAAPATVVTEEKAEKPVATSPVATEAVEANSATTVISADKSQLEVVLAQAKAKNLDGQEASVKAEVAAAIAEAEALVANGSASQDQVNQSVERLTQALASVKEVTAVVAETASETTTESSETPKVRNKRATTEGTSRAVDESRLDRVTVTKDNFDSYFKEGGTASYDETSGIIRLTEDKNSQAGNAYLRFKIDPREDFTFTGKVDVGDKYEGHGVGGDGVGFVFHTGEVSKLGQTGASVGMGQIPAAFGFKLDTYHNTNNPNAAHNSIADPKYGGVAYKRNAFGAFYSSNNAGKVNTIGDAKALSPEPSGQLVDFKISYIGRTKDFTVTYGGQTWSTNLATARAGNNTAVITSDAKTALNKPEATYALSFVASTGGATNLQRVQIEKFEFTAPQIVQVAFYDEAGNELAARSAIPGDRDQVVNLSNIEAVQKAISKLEAKGYTLKEVNSKKAETYNAGANTVTLRSGGQLLKYVFKEKEKQAASIQAPTNKVPVKNTTALTDDEKSSVEAAVKAVNPKASKVEVATDGAATVTFEDGSTATLTGDQTVKAADANGVKAPTTKTPVQNTSALTQPEKDAVKKAVETANPSATKVEVGNDGSATVTFPDGTTATLTGDKTVKEADSKGVKAPTNKVPVQNTSALTQPEKDAVKKAVEGANPSATKVEVGNDGSATVTFPDGSTATLTGDKTVKEADSKGVKAPTTKTPVQNTSALTQPEKDAVKKAVETANPSATKVEVGNDGSATVTFPDGTTATLPGAKTVKEADSKGVQEPAAKTPVQNTAALTQPEKDAVKKAVEDANQTATKVEVGNDGSATVTFPDGTTATLPGAKTVKEADSKGVQEPAAKTPVQNTAALTQPEKDAVKKAVEDANQTATKVEVGNDGSATVTFPDGTTATLPGAKTVKEADSKGVQEPAAKTPVQNTAALTQPEKDAVKKAVEDANQTATKVEVGNDGSATVTFPDGTTATLPGAKTVKEADSKGVQEPAAKTPVQNTSALTQPEKDAVKKAVEDANQTATKVEVGNDGSATVTFPDGTTATLPGAKTVKEADSKGVQEPAAKTPVKDTSALTDEEKTQVAEEIVKANPTLEDVDVANDGTATVTFPDGSTATLTPAQTVVKAEEKAKDADGLKAPATKTPVKDTANLTDAEKAEVKKAVEAANPGTVAEVGQDGTTKVTFPDKSEGTLTPEQTVVKAEEKAKDADGLKAPATKTPVKDTANLTDAEKAEVKKAVEAANPGSVAEVGQDGTTKVTFPDKSEGTLTPEQTVVKAEEKAKDADGLKAPATKTPVKDTANLTDAEKAEVKKAVEAANPGSVAEVGQDGTTKVTFPDKSEGTLTPEQTVVKAEEKAKDADGLKAPATKTPVKDTANLTDAEKAEVKKAVEAANPGTVAEVGQDGTTKVTFPDKSEGTLTPEQTVVKAEEKAKDADGLKAPATKTPVKDTANLTDAEKAEVKKAVEAANPGTVAEVGQDGTTKVTFSDKSEGTLTGDQTVKAADANGAKAPEAKTPVKDTSALTDEEKTQVAEEILKANPTLADVDVANDGTATVTFPDGSKATLTPAQTVVKAEEKAKDADGLKAPETKTPVKDTANLTDAEKAEVKKAVEAANPGTVAEVGQDGTTKVTFPDKSEGTLTPEQTVVKAEEKAKDADGLKAPATKTPVKDTANLTDAEKAEVKKAVEAANPGTVAEVGQDGTTKVTFPDKSEGTLTPEQTVVKAEEKAKDADGLKAPATKTPVKDTANLTDAEKAEVKKAVEAANPGSVAEVGQDGTTKVTFPDKSEGTLTPEQTVVKAEEKAKDADGLKAPATKTPVKDTANLTDAEKAEVKKAVEAANPGTVAEVGQDGTTTVTFPDGSTATLTGDKTVKEADSKGVQEPAAKTPVQNTSALTQPEKDAVKKAVADANPTATKVEVGNDGSATVTFPDGSTATLTPAQTVVKAEDKEAPTAPVVNPVKAGDTAITGKAEAGSTVEVTLPNGTKATATAGEDGTFSVPVSGLNEGDKVSVTATDAAGNKSGATEATVAKADDKEAPAAPVVNDVKEGDKAVTGTAEVGSIIEITLPNSETVTVRADEAGHFSLPVVGLKAGDKVTAVAKDASGNTSTPTEKTVGKRDVKDADGIQAPSTKTPVKDTANLTDAEKAKVKEAVEAANPGSKAEVGQDGTTTVTFPDGSTATLTGDQTVKTADSNGVQAPTTKTPVKDTGNLTDAEKAKVKEAVEAANPGSKAEVGQDGTTTVTFPDGSTATLTGDQTVKSADANGVKAPSAKTPVKDTANLTDAEKAKVKEAVEAANPGSKAEVGQDGTTTVTFPDGSTATLTGDQTVKTADSNGVQAPTTKTPVKDTANLTDAEKAKVKEAVEAANPGSKAEVGQDGTTTVTFPDGSTATLTGDQTVKTADSNGVQAPTTKTPVKDTANLTDAEKAKVKEAVEAANPGSKAEVGQDGTTTVTFPDGSTATLTGDKTVTQADITAPNAPVVNPVKAGDKAITGTAEAGSTVEVTLPDGTKVSAKADKDGKFNIPVNGLNAGDTVSVTATDESGNTSATTTVTVSNVNVGGKEADNAKVPALTPVVDPNNLTDAEKAKVAEEVKKANPTATDVKVNNDGSVVVTFADGSVATIAANKVVKEATKESSAQAPAKKAGAKELPNTGTKQSNASLGLALLAAVTGGLLISKKRKEEE